MLLAIWVAGRLAVAGLTGLGPVAVAVVDQAFVLVVAVMIAHEIVAGRNWRNFKVLIPVSLLWLANVLFLVEAMAQGSAGTSRRLGMVKHGATRLPVTVNRLDGLCLLSGAAALILWAVLPDHPATAVLAGLAAVMHLARVARWCGWATWRSRCF